MAAEWEKDPRPRTVDCEWTSEGAEITTRRGRTLVEELTFGENTGEKASRSGRAKSYRLLSEQQVGRMAGIQKQK